MEVPIAESETFRAMGTDAHVLLVGAVDGALARARRRIAALERRWSRFVPASEISHLNRASGHPVIVSDDTITLVARGIEGWRMTAGAFDPTVLEALMSCGYDRTFDDMSTADHDAPTDAPSTMVPGCAGIRVNRSIRMVMLPQRTGFDPGGLGKGLAADLVAQQLLTEESVRGVCVNVGGDLRAAGQPPTGDGWVVGVEHPLDPTQEVARITITEGAVATTSRTRRHWSRRGRELHHLIDPVTGLPMDTGLAAVTVVTAEAWQAEVLAKAAFLAGPHEGLRVLADAGATGLLVDDDGDVHVGDGMEVFLV